MSGDARDRVRELLLERHALVRTDENEKTFDRLAADIWIAAPGRALCGLASLVVQRCHRRCSIAEQLVTEDLGARLHV